MQSEAVYFKNSRILHVELDTSIVSIPNNAVDYQYCARIALNTHFPEGKILFSDVTLMMCSSKLNLFSFQMQNQRKRRKILKCLCFSCYIYNNITDCCSCGSSHWTLSAL